MTRPKHTPFGARIRAARKAKNVTRAELARRLNVKPPTITDYEQSPNVSEATLLKVAKALKMTVRFEFVDVPSESVAGFDSPLSEALAASITADVIYQCDCGSTWHNGGAFCRVCGGEGQRAMS